VVCWTPEPVHKYLDKHLIRWTSDEQCAAQFESLLEGYRNAGQYRAHTSIGSRTNSLLSPVSLGEPVVISNMILWQRYSEGREVTGPELCGALNATIHSCGSVKLGEHSPRRHKIKLIWSSGRGTLFHFPGLLASTFAYSPLCDVDVTFSELSPHAPIICLNIVDVSVNDEIFATDLRRPLQSQSLVQSSLPSLFLIEPCVNDTNHSPKPGHPSKV